MADSDLLITGIWIFAAFLFIIILYLTMNRYSHIFQSFSSGRMRSEQQRRQAVQAFMSSLRAKSTKPKWTGTVISLSLFFIFVFLILNKYLYLAVVTTDSMSPTFIKGDMVLMTKVIDLEEGDIVLFDLPNKRLPILHRVDGVDNGNITTKGDFLSVEDPWTITEADINGKAIMVGSKPIVLKGVGSYFIEDYQPGGVYVRQFDLSRDIIMFMKEWAVSIFIVTVALYIFITVYEASRRAA